MSNATSTTHRHGFDCPETARHGNVRTCADHNDNVVLNCDACKVSLYNLKRRAQRALRSIAEQAVIEGSAMLANGKDPVEAAHRLCLAWRAEVEVAA